MTRLLTNSDLISVSGGDFFIQFIFVVSGATNVGSIQRIRQSLNQPHRTRSNRLIGNKARIRNRSVGAEASGKRSTCLFSGLRKSILSSYLGQVGGNTERVSDRIKAGVAL